MLEPGFKIVKLVWQPDFTPWGNNVQISYDNRNLKFSLYNQAFSLNLLASFDLNEYLNTYSWIKYTSENKPHKLLLLCFIAN